jgi:hypothetical protein
MSAQVDAVLSSSQACENTALAAPEVRRAYKNASGRSRRVRVAAEGASGTSNLPEGECPICCDDMGSGRGAEATVACGTCRHHVHAKCMEHWTRERKRMKLPLQCVLCRAAWVHVNCSGAFFTVV